MNNCVYLIRAGRFFKIGHSKDPESRCRHINTNCPLSVELIMYFWGDEDDERRLHSKFSHLSHKGEWFRIDHRIREEFSFLVLRRGGNNGLGFVSKQEVSDI